ncbi:MAG TPA: oligosaccharide flippase family protein [Ktedonobacteraceae bacterium]|nr:oligosaccharide flippase family protein [Ktedonobacteraceae bacterium]
MMPSLDKAKDSHPAGNKKIGWAAHLTPFLEESRQYDTAVEEDTDTGWIDELPTLAIPAIGIDQMATCVNLKAFYKPKPTPHFVWDSTSISEQPTWIIPVLPASTKVPKPVVRDAGGGSYTSIILNLVKSSGIYALASLAAPLVSLILAPFLTRYLSYSDYGALVILNTFVALMAGVTQLGLGDAFFRAYSYDYESERDRKNVLSTILMLLLFISTPVAITGIVGAPWLATFLFDSPSLTNPVRIAAIVILMQNLTIPGFSWLRAENRAVLFSVLSIVNLLITLGSNFVLVGVMRVGIAGSLLATGSGYASVVICTLPFILLYAGLHLRLDITRGLLAFGLPHVINLISGWVLQLSDRYLLGHLGSLSQVAGYSVAYSLGGLLAIVISPFSLAWWSLMFPIAKRDDALQIFRLVFRWFSLVLLFATFGLSLFGTAILTLFFPPEYRAAAPIIPVIALSIMFNGIFVIVAIGTSLRRKTWLAAIFITFSALLNFCLNFVFIPFYGAMGAAVATLTAYVALALITYCANQWIYPVPFEVGLFSMALLVGLVLYSGSAFLAQNQELYVAWSIRTGSLLFYGMCLLLLGILPSRKSSKSPIDSQKRFIQYEKKAS